MRDSIEIMPVEGLLNARIRPPGSKSITNRGLVCAALAEGESTLRGALDSDDTRVMIQALERLQIPVRASADRTELVVSGCSGTLPAGKADLFVGNSGTSMRFLTAMLAVGSGEYRLDGVPRMRERPIGDLVDALQQLDVVIEFEGKTNCPPIIVRPRGWRGGLTTIRGDLSSQFLSGLLLAGPYAQQPLEIAVIGDLVSAPYVRMTVEIMRAFGASLEHEPGFGRITVEGNRYGSRDFAIEPDASAASYFFAAAAIVGGSVTVEGLSLESLQGDVAFCDCLAKMGASIDYAADSITVRAKPLRGIDVDMNAISDTVQTLAVVALFAEGPTSIRNVGHIRHKETDRLAATSKELRKLGATVEELDDGLVIKPPGKHFRGAEIDTYDDHRMAMSFALAGLKQANVVIRDPGCVAKTYPGFFQDLERVVRDV